MGKQIIRGKDLRRIDYSSNKTIAMAIDIAKKHLKHYTKDEQLQKLKEVKENFDHYLDDEVYGPVAMSFKTIPEPGKRAEIALNAECADYRVFGRKHISSNAMNQMDVAMKLPVVVNGALMPDAHQGYGLPIGGVLAAKNAVMPYGVGLDIGCRMSLTLYDADDRYLKKHQYKFKTALKEWTNFGNGGELNFRQEHDVLDRREFTETDLLRKLHGKAVRQLGTSGSGNHFVEFGMVEITSVIHGVEEGHYLGLLAHSGSRGLGASIAKFYTDIARSKCLLPRVAQNLAWLDLNTEEGQEYWISMNLAGDYARACHDRIHENLAKYLGLKSIRKIENHHNFAWKETIGCDELIVHRKGATPAGEGILGIIPGSMTEPGYIVKGLGNNDSLMSAAHGAGRKLSRTKAKASITGSELKKQVSRAGITLIGGGPDEAPMAYKDVNQVMQAQTDLVETVGKFYPKIVRMDKR